MSITERELVHLYRMGGELESLDRAFATLAEANETFFHHYKKRMGTFSCDYDANTRTIVATLYATQVIFMYQPTIDFEGKVRGKVVCFRAIRHPEKVQYEAIGSFSFDSSGATDIPANDGESAPTMYGDADAIVFLYLHKAMQAFGT